MFRAASLKIVLSIGLFLPASVAFPSAEDSRFKLRVSKYGLQTDLWQFILFRSFAGPIASIFSNVRPVSKYFNALIANWFNANAERRGAYPYVFWFPPRALSWNENPGEIGLQLHANQNWIPVSLNSIRIGTLLPKNPEFEAFAIEEIQRRTAEALNQASGLNPEEGIAQLDVYHSSVAGSLIKTLPIQTTAVKRLAASVVNLEFWCINLGRAWQRAKPQIRDQFRSQDGNQSWKQVKEQFWVQIGEQVWDQIDDRFWGQFVTPNWERKQVWDQIRKQAHEAKFWTKNAHTIDANGEILIRNLLQVIDLNQIDAVLSLILRYVLIVSQLEGLIALHSSAAANIIEDIAETFSRLEISESRAEEILQGTLNPSHSDEFVPVIQLSSPIVRTFVDLIEHNFKRDTHSISN